ncbi:MAG: DUF2135 domain-containing protein [Magnetococcales bacterium]|nr:DUF2135 domain-containing protein [Magnetococcales bacterium]
MAWIIWLSCAAGAMAAGFDCTKAATPVEHLICDDAEVSAADSRLLASFRQLQEAFKEDEESRSWYKRTQQQWLQESRNRCPDVACLRLVYSQRILLLEQAIPRPIVLDAPLGGWRNSFGEEVTYTQNVSYPATGVNSQEEGEQLDFTRRQQALIRGHIAANLKQANAPLELIVNGVPMPLLLEEGGVDYSRPYLFGTGSNGVEVRTPDGSARVRRQFYEAYNEKLRPRLRIVLSWDNGSTDLDLHVVTPKGEHCFYGNRTIPSGGALDVDVTTGYGPEIFAHPAPPPGTYLIYLNYFGGEARSSDGKSEQPIIVATLTIVSEEGSPDEKMQTFTVPVRRPGELVEVARFVYP